jgi:thiol:disulfide interchange protein DsbD
VSQLVSANDIFGVNDNPLSGIPAQSAEFLEIHEAFVFDAKLVDGGYQLTWDIADDYFLYLERFTFQALSETITLGSAQFSDKGKKKTDPYFGEVHVIHNHLSIFLPIELVPGSSSGELELSYQGCAEAGLCYPPERERLMYLPVSAKPPSTTNLLNADTAKTNDRFDNADDVFGFMNSSSLVAIVGIFFVLGLSLTFTPCVFPMIPIITSIIAGQQGQNSTARNFILALSYVLGMAITYSIAGTLTGILGAGANVQAALQNPALLSLFASIFILLSLSMFGWYELRLPSAITNRLNDGSQSMQGGKLISVFSIGALSALVVSPCVSAPLAGALLYISATADAVLGATALFALGLGMGVPLILIAVGGGKYLPKSGPWMDGFKAFFGVLLLAVAIWLLARFLPTAISMALWSLLALGSAVQLGAFDAARLGWPRFFKGIGLALAFYSALLLIGAVSDGSSPLKPLDGLQVVEPSRSNQQAPKKIAFQIIYDEQGLNSNLSVAGDNNQITMVDFYADWCISCIVMENEIFPLANISEKLSQMHLVKADVTENDQGNIALMESFGIFGPPSYLFFDQFGKELDALRIVGEVSAEEFDARLQDALSSSSP